MVNSISNMGGSMAMMQSTGMKRPPPPQGEDAFQLTDSDTNGSVSQTELTTLVEGIEEVTGSIIGVEEALSNFDANQDGELSGEELLEMMKGYGFSPPEMGPPPPSSEQALAAYGQNSGNDQMAQLLDLLQNGESEDEYTSVDVTT